MSVSISIEPFGELEGRMVNKFIVNDPNGIRITAINYGATVTGIFVPDFEGTSGNVVLGFDTLEDYIRHGNFYIGGICGRFANRIAGACFKLNGQEYRLSANLPAGCLHGGFSGFDKKYWEAQILPEQNGVKFMYRSPDKEEGFPGNLDATVIYRVVNNELHIEYSAVTDIATPVNLTNHSYFNLSCGSDADILSHELRIPANRIVEVDENYIPTGRLKDIQGTSLDFSQSRIIGGEGGKTKAYDYSWVINPHKSSPAVAAVLLHPHSGRELTVLTTQPAVHFYSGYLLDEKINSNTEKSEFGKNAGLCLETQHFPDSPNHSGFPDTIIRPGETYAEETIFRFSISGKTA